MYGLFHLIFSIYSLISYVGSVPLNTGFFGYWVPLCVGAFLFMSCYIDRTKPYIEYLLMVAVILLDVWTGWMCHVQAGQWYYDYLENILSVSSYSEAQVNVISNTIRDMISRNSINVHLIYAMPQCLAALFLSADQMLLLFGATVFICFAIISPNVSLGPALFALVTRVMVFLMFSVLCYWIKRMMMFHHVTEMELEMNLEASQEADSVLNHSLKNRMADAAGEVELFLSTYTGPHDALLECIKSLRRGMQMCQHRQAFLRLAAGKYETRMMPVNLPEFGNSLADGRTLLRKHFDPMWVQLDIIACGMIFENAISNAFKHGCPQDPAVTFTITAGPAEDLSHVHLEFCVKNHANRDRPKLTAEFLQKVVEGHMDKTMPVLSDRIGLSHCFMAAKACNIALSLEQEDTEVTFKASLIAEVMEPPVQGNFLIPRTQWNLPAGLRFHVIDDSAVARRLVVHQVMKMSAPASVTAFGAAADDVLRFVPSTIREADIALIDQNLEYADKTYLGTDLVEQLVEQGFKGLLCIRSANSSDADEQMYRQKGAHCVLGKDLRGSEMVEGLARAWHLLQERRPPVESLSDASEAHVIAFRQDDAPAVFV